MGSIKRLLLAVLVAGLPGCAFHLQGLSAGLWHESRADPPQPRLPAPVVVTTTTTTAAAPAPAPATSNVIVGLTRILMCSGKSDTEVMDALREAGVGAEAPLYIMVAQDGLCADGHPPRIR